VKGRGSAVRTAGAVLEASTFAGCPLATERRECLIELRHITTTTWLVDDDWRRRHRHVLRLLVDRLSCRHMMGLTMLMNTANHTTLPGHRLPIVVVATRETTVPIHRFTHIHRIV